MSAKPKILPPAAATTSYPMSPQEAVVFGRLFAQRGHLEAAMNAQLNQAAARLGVAIGTKIEVDLDKATYLIRA